MNKVTITVFLILFSVLLFSVSCKERNQKIDTLKELYKIYSNGEIDECSLNGQTVFTCGINAYDAGSTIYDLNGNVIGNCDYAWGGVDTVCFEVTG